MTPTQHQLICQNPHGNHQINYWQWGDVESQAAVICVHGLTRNGRDFDFLAQALADEQRVICVDIVGRGNSTWLTDANDYSYPLYIADMLHLIQQLQLETVDWVGTSMGGLIGMAIAGLPDTPLQRLVLNDIGALIPKAALQRIGTYLNQPPHIFATLDEVEQHLREVHGPFGHLTAAQWQHLAQHSHREVAGGYCLAYDPQIAGSFVDMNNITDIELWAEWQKVQCPVLLLHGVESDLLLNDTIEQMQTTHAALEVLHVVGVGHAPALMDAEQIAAVRNWLLG